MYRPYEVLEHTADVGIRARGQTLEEAFANMALGMMSLIVADPGRIVESEEKQVEAFAGDLEGLLVAWLSELVYLTDAERFLVAKVEDVRIGKRRSRRESVRAVGRAGELVGERAAGRPDGERTGDALAQNAAGGDLVEPGAWMVTALVRGEGLDPSKHPLEMEIKGVSYHLVKVERAGESGGWVAQAIFDV